MYVCGKILAQISSVKESLVIDNSVSWARLILFDPVAMLHDKHSWMGDVPMYGAGGEVLNSSLAFNLGKLFSRHHFKAISESGGREVLDVVVIMPERPFMAEVVRRLDEQAWPTYLTQTDGPTALNSHIQAVQRRNDVWLG